MLPGDALPPTEPGSPAIGAATIADGAEHRLDPRYVALRRDSGAISGLAFSAAVFFVVLFAPAPLGRLAQFGISAGFLAAMFVLAWVWPGWAWRHASYVVSPDGIEIRGGVWWRSAVNVPRSRIQHIDVAQGPLERRYGLATLKVYTAGTAHAEVLLPGITHGRATEIRDHLVAGTVADAV
jgi:membrane protein YdbS with pleckstrin-like domain